MADSATTAWTTVQIISLVGGSSVLAAFVTHGVALVRERFGEARSEKFAALYIAVALEEYARTTATLLGESETHEDSNGAAGKAHSNLAELPEYPEVNWQAFGIRRAEAAMGFRVDVDSQRNWISGYWDFAEEDEVVPEMQERAARLGLAAFTLAARFRKECGLKPLDQSERWSTKNDLTRRHEKFVARRLAYEARQRASNAEILGALQPNLEAG